MCGLSAAMDAGMSAQNPHKGKAKRLGLVEFQATMSSLPSFYLSLELVDYNIWDLGSLLVSSLTRGR